MSCQQKEKSASFIVMSMIVHFTPTTLM